MAIPVMNSKELNNIFANAHIETILSAANITKAF